MQLFGLRWCDGAGVSGNDRCGVLKPVSIDTSNDEVRSSRKEINIADRLNGIVILEHKGGPTSPKGGGFINKRP